MKPVEKLEADRERQAKAVDRALARTKLIKEELDPYAFPTINAKASYVQQLYNHKPTPGEGSIEPPTKTLLDRVKMRREQAHQRHVLDLEVQRQGLVAEGLQIDKAAEAVAAARRPKKTTLAEAMKNDDRLEALPVDEMIHELMEDGTIAKPTTLEDFIAQKDRLKIAKRKPQAHVPFDGFAPSVAGSSRQGDDGDDDASRQHIDEHGGSDGDEGTSVDGTSVTGTSVTDTTTSTAADEAKASRANKTAEVLRQLKQRKEGAGVTLNKLVHAIKQDMPDNEQALHEMKMKQAVLQTRLQWADKRPTTYVSEMPRTAKAKLMKDTCGQLVGEIVDMAMKHISLRPTKAQVAAEVHEWKAKQLGALMGIARHLADAVLKDVVDELIAEVSQETHDMQKSANQFAFDLLVEAVAYSQGKFDFGHDDVHARLRELAKQEEKSMQTAVATRQQMMETRAKSRADKGKQLSLTADPDEILNVKSGRSGSKGRSRSRSRKGSLSMDGAFDPDHVLPGDLREEGGITMHKGETFLDDEEQDDEDEEQEEERPASMYQQHHVDEDATFDDPFGTLDTEKHRLIPQRRIKFGEPVPEDLDQETLIYVAHRQFDDEKMNRADKQLYVLGLKAMLQEMRKRRGDAPYGHTQQLSIAWPRDVHLSRARVIAAERMRPPLTAGPAVWKKWDENKSKIKFAARHRSEHMRAAEVERVFWRNVTFKPFFLGEAKVGPLLYVRDKLAPITCISPSTSGHYMAVGTATGATVVFDLRSDPSNPWFELVGDGEQIKAGGLFSHGTAAKPPILALDWSTDSYQLASLDGSFCMRMWWMRQSPGQVIKDSDGPKRQPVLPDMALSMGPLMMALSGKAPLHDALLNAEEQPAAARQWCLAFHRAFNVTGTQPALLVPQITGDLLRVHTSVGDSLLPMPLPRTLLEPKPLLNMQTVNFLMPPQTKSPEVRSQSIYRGHNGNIVFVSFLSDNTTIVSVDDNGQTNVWPAHESGRTGFGWFQPKATWSLPRQLKTWKARGPLYPLWPRKPQTVGFTLFGWITTKQPDTSGASFEDYISDPGLLDAPNELERLEDYPMGNFLLEGRVLWLVRYRREGTAKKGQVFREEIHRPLPNIQTDGVVKPLVISSYEYPSGNLVRRSKQYTVVAKFDYKVVSACLTKSQRDLLLWCRVAASSQDPESFPFFSCHVLNLEVMRPLTPRIDIYDHSNGAAPPAYAVSPMINALGSEYLFVGLGCGNVGVYSIATGQQVRELSFNLPLAPYFVSLQLFTISHHMGTYQNAGKTILAVVVPNSQHVHMLEVNDELSTAESHARRGTVGMLPPRRGNSMDRGPPLQQQQQQLRLSSQGEQQQQQQQPAGQGQLTQPSLEGAEQHAAAAAGQQQHPGAPKPHHAHQQHQPTHAEARSLLQRLRHQPEGEG